MKAYKHLVQGNELREVFSVVVSGDYREVALSVHFVLNLQFGWLPAEIYPDRQSCKSCKLGKNIFLSWITLDLCIQEMPISLPPDDKYQFMYGKSAEKRLIVWQSFAIQEHRSAFFENLETIQDILKLVKDHTW